MTGGASGLGRGSAIGLANEGATVVVADVAASEAEAKRKLLGMASQYGRVDPQGLHDYVVEAGIEWDEMAKSFATPDINMEAMLRDYFEVSDAEMVEAGLIDPNPSPLIAHDQETRYDFVVRCDTAEQLQKVRDFFSATKATVSFAAAARYLWD